MKVIKTIDHARPRGHTKIYLKKAETGLIIPVYDHPNTITGNFRTSIARELAGNPLPDGQLDFSLTSLFTAAEDPGSGTQAGNDGIIVRKEGTTDYLSTVTTLTSQTDSTGSQNPGSVQWRGEITFSANTNVNLALLGKNYSISGFGFVVASQSFTTIQALQSDTLVIEWTVNS